MHHDHAVFQLSSHCAPAALPCATVRRSRSVSCDPVHGGGQERRDRSSSPCAPGIHGCSSASGCAAEKFSSWEQYSCSIWSRGVRNPGWQPVWARPARHMRIMDSLGNFYNTKVRRQTQPRSPLIHIPGPRKNFVVHAQTPACKRSPHVLSYYTDEPPLRCEQLVCSVLGVAHAPLETCNSRPLRIFFS
jgi:hypothetical protein